MSAKSFNQLLRRRIVPTAESERLFSGIRDALLRRRQGVVIFARSGAGLTSAFSLANKAFSNPMEGIVVMQCAGFTHPHNELWPHFVAGEQWPKGLRETHAKRSRTRLVHRICQRVTDSNSDSALLIVDRAHDLIDRQLAELAKLQDDLAGESVHLMVCLGGNQLLRKTEEDLRHASSTEALTRYFSTQISFDGMASVDDLAHYLSWFDRHGLHELGILSISRHCYQESFDRGWRLEAQARQLWDVLTGYLSAGKDIEMQALHEIVCNVLEAGAAVGAQATPPSQVEWLKHITCSTLGVLRAQEHASNESNTNAKIR